MKKFRLHESYSAFALVLVQLRIYMIFLKKRITLKQNEILIVTKQVKFVLVGIVILNFNVIFK